MLKGLLLRVYRDAQCPQLDVAILALNSQHLVLADYVDAFRDVIKNPPFRDLSGRYRLGFYVVHTAELRRKVPLKGGAIDRLSFLLELPHAHVSERVDDAMQALATEFEPERPNRRCIVVASAACRPPQIDHPAGARWKDVAAVDVILISAHKKAPKLTPELQSRWASYCKEKQGQLVYLTCDQENPQPDRKIVTQLQLHLIQIVSPFYRP